MEGSIKYWGTLDIVRIIFSLFFSYMCMKFISYNFGGWEVQDQSTGRFGVW